ncbi:ATP-binding protein [Streptomyces sp. NPDC014006]|uniref:ATP-binding protein n=1 Tax=Streptomyces sp. NPDC014006 TaxID=3364870 RepID=UPI0036F8A96C
MSAEYAIDPLDTGGCDQCGVCCPADVRAAVRSAVDRRCRATGAHCDEESLSDALLVASELTSNAILHGGGVTDYAVDLVSGGVRVSVCDRSRRLPVTTGPLDTDGRRRVGGRGWPIVCRLSRDVHVTDLPAGGKRITAEVPVFR